MRALLVCLLLLVLCGPLPVQSGTPAFESRATLVADARQVDATLELALHGEDTVFATGLIVQSAGHVARLPGPAVWRPGELHEFHLKVASENTLPGNYMLLLTVEYQDDDRHWHSYPFAVNYFIGPQHDTPLRTPDVTLKGDQLRWQLSGVSPDDVSLTLSAAPLWKDVATMAPKDQAFQLVPVSDRAAAAGGIYPQLARLDWSKQGIHYSKLIPWSVRTDHRGQWLDYTGEKPRHGWWRSGYWLQLASITVALLALLWTLAVFRRTELPLQTNSEALLSRYLGWLLAAGLTLWVADHTRLDLWTLSTWATGGDTASHILYANVFRDWLAQGKISGGMPEVFMGFPAFPDRCRQDRYFHFSHEIIFIR